MNIISVSTAGGGGGGGGEFRSEMLVSYPPDPYPAAAEGLHRRYADGKMPNQSPF